VLATSAWLPAAAPIRPSDDSGGIACRAGPAQNADRGGAGRAIAFHNRGRDHQDKRDYERAIQDFDQAIRLGHTDYRVLFNRGDVYCDKGDYDRAIQDFDQAIRLKPGFALAISRRADAYRAKGEPAPR
jgi:tetratricopeptide (TPR) repeat protein